jgi:hypothetical protein
MPRPPISRVPTAFTSSTLPGFTPGIVWSLETGVDAGADVAGAEDAGVDDGGAEDEAAGVSDGAGVADGAGVCWLVCGLFCPYPVETSPGANSKLLATMSSAGISFLRSILFITTPHPLRPGSRRRSTL